MKDDRIDHKHSQPLVQHYRLDAPLEKVWRAISIPALRAHWLPDLDLVSAQPEHSIAGEEIRYVMREPAPPHLESRVTLQLVAAPGGGTVLTIIHAPGAQEAANDHGQPLMCAA